MRLKIFLQIKQDQRGVAALLTVVVILAFTLALGLLVSKIAVNELALSLDADQSHQAMQAAESCADEAAFRLKRNSGYTGGTIAVANGTCTVSISGGGSSRTATITSTYGEVSRNLVLSINLTSNVAVTSEGTDITDWEEN